MYLSKYSSKPVHILSKSEKNSLASLHFYYIFRNNSCLHCYLVLHYYQIFRKIPTYTIIPSYIFIIFWFKFPTTLLFGTHYYSEHESRFEGRYIDKFFHKFLHFPHFFNFLSLLCTFVLVPRRVLHSTMQYTAAPEKIKEGFFV